MVKGKKQKKAAAPALVPAEKKIKKAQNKGKAPASVAAPSAPTHSAAHTDGGAASGGRKEGGSEKRVGGFIFLCSTKTKPECYKHRVFGLPKGRLEVVEKIKRGAKLFLFDFERKLLYGVYKATSDGGLNLDASAFNGKFPAQVKFKIDKDCLPLPEDSFKQAIKENYHMGKFDPELSFQQVKSLLLLFRPVTSMQLSSIPQVVANRDRPLPPDERYRGHHYSSPPLQTEPRYAPPMVSRLPHDPYIRSTHVTRPPPVMEPHQYRPSRLSSHTGPYYPAGVHLPPPNDAYYQHVAMTEFLPGDDVYFQPASGMPPRNDVHPATGSYHNADARIYYRENPPDRYRAVPLRADLFHVTEPAAASAYAEPPSWQTQWAPVYDDSNRRNTGSLHRAISGRGDVPNLPRSSLYSFAGVVPGYR
uniref:B2 protein n=1 Tax=Anthurium amnicola TaxID=1678845 RepID=A0A1D1Z0J3_9ARAE